MKHVFTTTMVASDRAATVEAPPRPALSVGAPPEFGGGAEEWSPEHLLLASVSSCFWTTYRALAARKGVTARAITCRASGTVEKTSTGLMFTAIHLAVDIDVDPGALELAHELAAKAEKACLVSASLRTPVTVEAVVTTTMFENGALP